MSEESEARIRELNKRVKKWGSPDVSESDLIALLTAWKLEAEKLDEALQTGRCGRDDGSFRHGRMDMLEDCIEELAAVLKSS